MKPLIRTLVDDSNRLSWILSGESMEGAPQHECPHRELNGACGFTNQCSKCERVK